MPDFDERVGRDAWTAAAEQTLHASFSPAGAENSRATLGRRPAGERPKAAAIGVSDARVCCTRDGAGVLGRTPAGSATHGIGTNPNRTAGRACAIAAARTFGRCGIDR